MSSPIPPVMMALALAAGIAGQAPAHAASDAVSEGRVLAERLCARCHLNPGQGEKESPSEIPGFRAVANRSGQSVEGVVSWLAGLPTMMPNHHLSRDEMLSLAIFIMSLRREPVSAPLP